MWNRNRIGSTVIVACLLFDAFIINERAKAHTNINPVRCYPARGVKHATTHKNESMLPADSLNDKWKR